MEIEPENEKRKKIMRFFGGGKLMLSQMDKFQHWVASKDVARAKMLGLFGLTPFKLTPIKHLIVKEFL